MPFTATRLRRDLERRRPSSVAQSLAGHWAAVAVVVRFSGPSPSVLMMKRADRPSDRWSGQVSFPGGRAEPMDADLRATAVRETREEVGLDLALSANCIGRLDDMMAIARGRVLPMGVRPFVFEQVEDSELKLGAEAAAAFWLPLDEVLSGGLDGRTTYQMGPVPMQLPCWNYEGHVVWGMTHRMLTQLLKLVR